MKPLLYATFYGAILMSSLPAWAQHIDIDSLVQERKETIARNRAIMENAHRGPSVDELVLLADADMRYQNREERRYRVYNTKLDPWLSADYRDALPAFREGQTGLIVKSEAVNRAPSRIFIIHPQNKKQIVLDAYKQVFSPQQRQMLGEDSQYLYIRVFIDGSTSRIAGICFNWSQQIEFGRYNHYTKIPISQFREFEKLLMANLNYEMTEEGRKLNFYTDTIEFCYNLEDESDSFLVSRLADEDRPYSPEHLWKIGVESDSPEGMFSTFY
ncbi:MAG: DUF5043 domain-containing protein [Rikenellaceae bacterium]|nr:DUF5043 domain-containing protein [Rikenellaceae bacterium]